MARPRSDIAGATAPRSAVQARVAHRVIVEGEPRPQAMRAENLAESTIHNPSQNGYSIERMTQIVASTATGTAEGLDSVHSAADEAVKELCRLARAGKLSEMAMIALNKLSHDIGRPAPIPEASYQLAVATMTRDFCEAYVIGAKAPQDLERFEKDLVDAEAELAKQEALEADRRRHPERYIPSPWEPLWEPSVRLLKKSEEDA